MGEQEDGKYSGNYFVNLVSFEEKWVDYCYDFDFVVRSQHCPVGVKEVLVH
jgi:hypothetical protein